MATYGKGSLSEGRRARGGAEMRGRVLAGAVVLGCAGLLIVGPAAPVMAERSGAAGRMAAGDTASHCEQAGTDVADGGPAIEVTTDVEDGSTVAPGQEVAVRLTWDPKAGCGQDLDRTLACVRVEGSLDPDQSAEESPTANDGVFEYSLRIPDDIRPGCDVCVEAFLTGLTAD